MLSELSQDASLIVRRHRLEVPVRQHPREAAAATQGRLPRGVLHEPGGHREAEGGCGFAQEEG